MRSSSCEVIFLLGRLPVRSSSCEVVFIRGCLLYKGLVVILKLDFKVRYFPGVGGGWVGEIKIKAELALGMSFAIRFL